MNKKDFIELSESFIKAIQNVNEEKIKLKTKEFIYNFNMINKLELLFTNWLSIGMSIVEKFGELSHENLIYWMCQGFNPIKAFLLAIDIAFNEFSSNSEMFEMFEVSKKLLVKRKQTEQQKLKHSEIILNFIGCKNFPTITLDDLFAKYKFFNNIYQGSANTKNPVFIEKYEEYLNQKCLNSRLYIVKHSK